MSSSFGAIPYRISWDGVIQVALVENGRGEWGFPKGGLGWGETPLKAARREFRAETTLNIVKWHSRALILLYKKNGVEKTSKLWFVEASGAKPQPDRSDRTNDAVDGDWFTLEDAYERATGSATKKAVLKLSEIFWSNFLNTH